MNDLDSDCISPFAKASELSDVGESGEFRSHDGCNERLENINVVAWELYRESLRSAKAAERALSAIRSPQVQEIETIITLAEKAFSDASRARQCAEMLLAGIDAPDCAYTHCEQAGTRQNPRGTVCSDHADIGNPVVKIGGRRTP